MSTPFSYDDWKRRQAEAGVPPGFSERVMSRLPRSRPILAWVGTPLGKAAVLVLGSLVFLGRIASLFLVFAPR